MKNRWKKFREALEEAREPIANMIDAIRPFLIILVVVCLAVSIYTDYVLSTKHGMDRPGLLGWIVYFLWFAMLVVPYTFRWIYNTDQIGNQQASDDRDTSTSKG
jgi:hypothetical protein